MAGEISPISSRKSVPPLACSNLPFFCATAPVKAPRSCPKSSDSNKFSASAPQLIARNRPVRRGLSWWISRAVCSLPVPVSPVISTVTSDCATFRTRPNRSCMGRLLPTNPPVSVAPRSEEHTSELQSLAYLVCRLLLEKKKQYPIRRPACCFTKQRHVLHN